MIPMKQSHQAGITLIELMIVVIIVGILMAIGLPSFQGSLQKGRRADAMAGLQELANRQEKYLLDRGRYTTSFSNLNLSEKSTDGHYDLAIDAPVAGVCEITNCYRLTATPASGSPQENDSRCTRFILNSTGLKEAEGSASDQCWN